MHPVSTQEVHPTSRIYYLDNLRALAMMMGVFLHAGLAYANPAQSVWLATDSSSSIVVDVFIWFIHLFRMALFFLISGYFAKLLIERKGVKGFLWNRTVRIVVPFLLFYPFLLAAMAACVVFALSYLKQPTGLIGVIDQAIKNGPQVGQKQPLTTMHLWFLYYLFLFSLLAAFMARIPSLRWTWLQKQHWLVWFAPLTLVPGAMAGGIPMAAPESFIPNWWPFAFYGLFYLWGWCLYGQESKIDKLRKFMIPLFIIVVLLFIPYYRMMPVLDLKRMMPVLDLKRLVPLDRAHLLFEGTLGSYLSVLLVLLALLIGRRFLDWHSSFMRFISDASYWVYLVHLPIVVLIQTLLIESSINVWLKLCITTGSTFAVCLLTYAVFVRYTPIGWLLNGKRKFP